jgi:hypothetical protein
MHARQLKEKVVAKLIGARGELEEVLKLTAPGARYDPVVIALATRNELSVMSDDLHRIIVALKGAQ